MCLLCLNQLGLCFFAAGYISSLYIQLLSCSALQAHPELCRREGRGRTEDQPEPHSAAASHLHRLPASHRSCCRPLLSPLKPSPPPPACPPSRRLPSGYAPRCLCRHRFLPRFHILPMRSCWEALDLFLVFSGFFLLWWYGGGGVCVWKWNHHLLDLAFIRSLPAADLPPFFPSLVSCLICCLLFR